jgi:hypothetical protein
MSRGIADGAGVPFNEARSAFATGAVAHDDARTVDEGYHVLNDRGVLPNIVDAPAPKPCFVSSLPYAFIDRVEARIERHHSSREGGFNVLVFGDLEDCWTLAAWPDIAEQEAVKVHVFYGPMVARELKVIGHVERHAVRVDHSILERRNLSIKGVLKRHLVARYARPVDITDICNFVKHAHSA